MTAAYTRPSLPARVDTVIIGSGYSGLCVAIQMKRAAMSDFIVLEQADDIGGTWRDNDYPGAACDIPSNLYSYSFEPNPNWTRVYPQQPELRAYIHHCADKYGLRAHIHCGARVSSARFDETMMCWRVMIDDTHELLTRIIVSGTGSLSRPKIPEIGGLAEFAGIRFHSARWRHDVALQGKRVAVLGNGASAVQFVPQIAPQVAQLLLFQRTPAWIMPKPDRALTDAERSRLRRFPLWQRLQRAAIYVRQEYRAAFFTRWPRVLRSLQPRLAGYLGRRVRDPELQRKLTPNYVLGCKRILLSNDFYPALASGNVELVTDGIERIEAQAIRTTDGRLHPVDVIVLATGFQVADAGAPFAITGVGGISLDTAWVDGAQAHRGTTVAGFPNLFLMTGPNTGLGHNSMIYMIESQARYVLDALRTMRQRHWRAVDVQPAAQQRYNAQLQSRMPRTVWASGGCRSWYLSADGSNRTLWPDFTFLYRHLTRSFDAQNYRAWPDDKPAGDLSRAASPASPATR